MESLPSAVLSILTNLLLECRRLAETGNSTTHLQLLQMTEDCKKRLDDLLQ